MIEIELCRFSLFLLEKLCRKWFLTFVLEVALFYFLWYSFDMLDYGKRVDVCCY